MNDLHFVNQHLNYAYGQDDFVLYAVNQENVVLGRILYAIHREQVHINFIEVAEEYQRQGIATLLWNELIDLWPELEFPPSSMTPEGEALRNSLYPMWQRRRLKRRSKKRNKQEG